MPLAYAADGASVFWAEAAGAEAAGHAAPTALWLHGLGRDGAYFADAPRWLPHWRHVTVDLRGFSRSLLPSASAGSPVSLQLWADDVAAVLAAACCDGERVLLVGHSLGAAVATQFAASHPERVAALVLAAPSARVGPAAAARWAAAAAEAAARGDTGFAAAAQALARGYDLRPALATIKQGTPLLLLAGGRDELTPPKAAEAVQRAARSAAVTLCVVPQAGHDALRDAPHVRDELARWARDVAEPAIRAASSGRIASRL